MTYIVVDVEATGLERLRVPVDTSASLEESGSEVIQIGGIILNNSLEPVRCFCHYCDCLVAESESAALKTHGIRMRDVRAYLSNIYLEDVILTRIPELLLEDLTLIGYNVGFDIAMIRQSVRNALPFFIGDIPRVMSRLPTRGHAFLDVMSYLPHRVKLSSFHDELAAFRGQFLSQWGSRLTVDSNCWELLQRQTWQAHSALFDCIETYGLLVTKIIGKKILVRR